jgi:hypothetical protein
LHCSIAGSNLHFVGSAIRPPFTPSSASHASTTARCSSCVCGGASRAAAFCSSVFSTRTACAARPVQSSPGAPAMMPSKSSGKRCASFIAWRPPAEQPFQYEWAGPLS